MKKRDKIHQNVPLRMNGCYRIKIKKAVLFITQNRLISRFYPSLFLSTVKNNDSGEAGSLCPAEENINLLKINELCVANLADTSIFD
uniref:hypothetical protein n=1 Tax=Morganella morganii TaxID=582 RepID=UPI000E0E1547|nr:hypothetical protein [Morganella morganii]